MELVKKRIFSVDTSEIVGVLESVVSGGEK